MNDDERAIRAVQTEWIDATAKGDLARVLSLMADDAVFLTPGQPPFGRDKFAAGFTAGQQQQAQFAGTAEFEEVVVVGDVAYARGRLAISVTPKDGAAKRLAGYTLTVFRKLADGRWVLARDANLLTPVQGTWPE